MNGKKKNSLVRKEGRIHVSLETPCSVSELESLLHMVSQSGHWHDAEVRGEDGKIVFCFDVDEDN